jgi:hypothetical protein
VANFNFNSFRYIPDDSFVLPTVKNDTFRTLATDTNFKSKVKEDMLIRLLECFVWRNVGKRGRRSEDGGSTDRGRGSSSESGDDGVGFGYVQGKIISLHFRCTEGMQC